MTLRYDQVMPWKVIRYLVMNAMWYTIIVDYIFSEVGIMKLQGLTYSASILSLCLFGILMSHLA